MCFTESTCSNNKLKCTIISVTSLIIHIVVLCLSIPALMVATKIRSPDLLDFHHYITQNVLMSIEISTNSFIGLSGSLVALSVLGMTVSIILMLGLKYNKPGYVVLYFCYSVQMIFLLIITGLLLCLKSHWKFAAATFCLVVLICRGSVILNRTYEAMVQNASQAEGISDRVLLIEDSLNDDPSEIKP